MPFIPPAPTGGGSTTNWVTVSEEQHVVKVLGLFDVSLQLKKSEKYGDKEQHQAIIAAEVDPSTMSQPDGSPIIATTILNMSVKGLEKAAVTPWLKLVYPGLTYQAIEAKYGGEDLEPLFKGLDCMATVKHLRSQPEGDLEPWNRYYLSDPKPMMAALKPISFTCDPDLIPEGVTFKRERTIYVGGWEKYLADTAPAAATSDAGGEPAF